MISLTESAAIKLKSHLETTNKKFVRVGVRGGGCSGFTYFMDSQDSHRDDDKIIEEHGVKIVVDRKSYLYLMGMSIDYVDSLNGAGFKFNNPSAKRTCGCGESFSV